MTNNEEIAARLTQSWATVQAPANGAQRDKLSVWKTYEYFLGKLNDPLSVGSSIKT